MSYNILLLPFFDKQLKRLVKKYPSLKKEFAALLSMLSVDPVSGALIGHNCYKIRLAIASKNKGKSGGARVITCVQIMNETVYLLTIYDKGEQGSITDSELKELIDQIPS